MIWLHSFIKPLTTAVYRTVHSFLPKKFPVAYKLALIFTVILSCGMVLLGLVIARDQNRMLEQQMIGSSKTVLKQLAMIAKDPLLASDLLSLDVIVNNLIEKD
ncbi:MAG: hypothetical protein WCQ99_14315, partial [Pseudomonadota bacterium]